MFKNVRIKRILKGTVFLFASRVNMIIPKRDDYVLLYSANKGLCFNLLPLKEYLLNEGYQNYNRIVCGVESKDYYGNEKGIEYKSKIAAYLFFFRAGHVFYTVGQIPIKPSKKQIVLHMHHGITFKTTGKMTHINNGDENYFTYCFGTSDIYRDIYSYAFNCKREQVLINSEPITDIFYTGSEKKYDLGDFCKVLIWVPTFRQSDYLGYDDSAEEELLPLFREDDYKELNSMLKAYNFKLIVKLHPAQDLSKYKTTSFSNLCIMSSKDFDDSGMNLYELLLHTDALISDYSSIFLQYLLIDKPLAFAIPDYEEYKMKRGFAFSNPKEYMAGWHLYSKEDFYLFLKDLSNDRDVYADQRRKIKEIIHQYSDGKSCQRLVEISGIRIGESELQNETE